MNTFRSTVCALFLSLAFLGCEAEPAVQPIAQEKEKNPPSTPTTPEEATKQPAKPGPAKKVALGNAVWFETQGDHRRVLVSSIVCLREGSYGLECLLCRTHTKEHESILSTDADAQVIHAALIAARAKPGLPVQYQPKFKPPSGSRIKVALQYDDKGKILTIPAQRWVQDVKSKKELDLDWVFTGSMLFPNQEGADKPPLYGATLNGSYICVSNVPTALLDLPINSPKGLEDRQFGIFTERVPPLETKVTLILEPEDQTKKP